MKPVVPSPCFEISVAVGTRVSPRAPAQNRTGGAYGSLASGRVRGCTADWYPAGRPLSALRSFADAGFVFVGRCYRRNSWQRSAGSLGNGFSPGEKTFSAYCFKEKPPQGGSCVRRSRVRRARQVNRLAVLSLWTEPSWSRPSVQTKGKGGMSAMFCAFPLFGASESERLPLRRRPL
jgi:hypothetical protein